MDTSADADALVTIGLRKTFEATDDDQIPVRALRGLDISVARGEFVAVMGPSGCGKSTMLNLVAGLDTPTDGTIEIDGETITGLSEDDLATRRRRHIGIVFQFFNLLEGMSVLENVAMPAAVAGRSRKQAETRARDLLDLLGIADKSGASPGRLSGGQRQRLHERARGDRLRREQVSVRTSDAVERDGHPARGRIDAAGMEYVRERLRTGRYAVDLRRRDLQYLSGRGGPAGARRSSPGQELRDVDEGKANG